MIFGALICRFRGHKWRRARKKGETHTAAFVREVESTSLFGADPTPRYRICRVCGTSKFTKARKPKAPSA